MINTDTLAALAPLDPASGTVTISRATSTDPNVDYPTASPAGATAGSKVTAPTGATARAENTPSSAWVDDDARTAVSASATAPGPSTATTAAALSGCFGGSAHEEQAK